MIQACQNFCHLREIIVSKYMWPLKQYYKHMKTTYLAILLIVGSFILGGCKTKMAVPDVGVNEAPTREQQEVLPIQEKYGQLLGVSPSTLNNIALYELIDDWMQTPYMMGGESKKGIDCSSFTQLVYTKIYDKYIERTAEKQFSAESTDKFRDQHYLKEGDLLFFTRSKKENIKITHVGMYLTNDRFVHATARKGVSGYSGVKVSNIKDSYWQARFVAGGRKISSEKP